MKIRALVITSNLHEVVEYHEAIGEKNWYKENFGGQYPTGPHMSYGNEWMWYHNSERPEDDSGTSDDRGNKNMVSQHEGCQVYTLKGFLKLMKIK